MNFDTFSAAADAILVNDLRVFAKCVEQDASIAGYQDPDNSPLIHAAAESAAGREIIKLLIDHGAEVNGAWRGIRPIHIAAKNSPLDSVRAFLEHGADPNCLTTQGSSDYVLNEDSTPLLIAVQWQPFEGIPELLVEHGSKLDVHSAVVWSRPDEVQRILSENPNAVVEAPRPRDILHQPIWDLDAETLELLLEHGANPNTARCARSSIEALIEKYDDDCQIALRMLELLLKYGADPNFGFPPSKGVLAVARKWDIPDDAIELLRAHGAR